MRLAKRDRLNAVATSAAGGAYPVSVPVTHTIPAVRADYGDLEIWITENGAAFSDERSNGHVDDPRRTAYIEGHLGAVARALDAGVPVAGYFVWSLLDNFEWALGYGPTFGLVEVDRSTFVRTPKPSARWLGSVARANALPG